MQKAAFKRGNEIFKTASPHLKQRNSIAFTNLVPNKLQPLKCWQRLKLCYERNVATMYGGANVESGTLPLDFFFSLWFYAWISGWLNLNLFWLSYLAMPQSQLDWFTCTTEPVHGCRHPILTSDWYQSKEFTLDHLKRFLKYEMYTLQNFCPEQVVIRLLLIIILCLKKFPWCSFSDFPKIIPRTEA